MHDDERRNAAYLALLFRLGRRSPHRVVAARPDGMDADDAAVVATIAIRRASRRRLPRPH